MKFKVRLFYPSIVMSNAATGRVEIKSGSKDYALRLIESEIGKCQKIIVEVV